MYAVIISGGKQHRVSEGQKIKLETIPAEVGAKVNFDQVLMVAKDDNIMVGTPYVEGSKVSATVIQHGRGKKIHILKHRRRKHYHKEMGHRQNFTEVEITNIKI